MERLPIIGPPPLGLDALRAPRTGPGAGVHEDGVVQRGDEEAELDRAEDSRAGPLARDEAGQIQESTKGQPPVSLHRPRGQHQAVVQPQTGSGPSTEPRLGSSIVEEEKEKKGSR